MELEINRLNMVLLKQDQYQFIEIFIANLKCIFLPIFSSTGTSTCNGDSGGPLACKNSGKFYVQGATSFGSGAGCTAAPTVFTRVAEFRDWIDWIIENNSGELKFSMKDFIFF